MPPDPPALRRARRLVDQLLGGLASVQLGSVTRDLERLDRDEPVRQGEMAIGRGIAFASPPACCASAASPAMGGTAAVAFTASRSTASATIPIDADSTGAHSC